MRRVRALTTLLWLCSAAGTAVLFRQRYVGGTARLGVDFAGAYWPAAQAVANGGSPFSADHYVYSPLVALVLAPFTGNDIARVFSVWVAVTIGSIVLAALLLTLGLGAPGWRRPVLFGAFVVTGLHFWPTTMELFLGQVHGLLLLIFVCAVVATARGWEKSAAVLLGLGAVVKTWPAGFGVVLLRRPKTGVLLSFVGTALVAPLLALTIGGPRMLGDFYSRTVGSADQSLISHSVWGFAENNFSATGLSQPILAADLARVAVEVILAVVLVAVALDVVMHADDVLAMVYTAPVVVLLLPVSHLDYTIFTLPLLWLWLQRAVEGRERRVWLPALIMIGWWVVVAQSWLDDGGPPGASSLRYSVVFVAQYSAVVLSGVVAVATDPARRGPGIPRVWGSSQRIRGRASAR